MKKTRKQSPAERWTEESSPWLLSESVVCSEPESTSGGETPPSRQEGRKGEAYTLTRVSKFWNTCRERRSQPASSAFMAARPVLMEVMHHGAPPAVFYYGSSEYHHITFTRPPSGSGWYYSHGVVNIHETRHLVEPDSLRCEAPPTMREEKWKIKGKMRGCTSKVLKNFLDEGWSNQNSELVCWKWNRFHQTERQKMDDSSRKTGFSGPGDGLPTRTQQETQGQIRHSYYCYYYDYFCHK